MYFVITITLIVTIIFFVKELTDWYDWFGSLGMSIAVAIITFIISSALALFFSAAAYGTDNFVPIETVETKLIALNDNMGITGARYLYSGYVNEELKYTYLYTVPGKGIASKTIKADDCYIIESEKPRLVKTTYAVDTNRFVDFFTFDFLLRKTDYILFVPNGSIIAAGEYKIDLE